MIQVVIGGDVCPIGKDIRCFVDGDAAGIFHDLLDEFRAADAAIVNLECPLTDTESPIRKCGPALRAPAACIQGLKQAGVGVLNLANNHILDQGAAGLESTLRAAEAAGIAIVGAGRNRDDARRILVRTVGDVRIGILAVAEHEFSIATDTSPGASPLDLIDIVRNIESQRTQWDYLLVLVHGGNEGYAFPSPRLMDTCRFLVEQGAGAVICQHSHCVGCYEEYRGGHIVYGQGNLVFDNANPPPGWNEGVLVRLSITANGAAQMDLIPLERCENEPGVRKMVPAAARTLLEGVADRSRSLHNPGFVEEQWRRFCGERETYYVEAMFGYGSILSRLNQYGHISRYFPSRKARLCLENVIRCEAHREVLETIFKQQALKD